MWILPVALNWNDFSSLQQHLTHRESHMKKTDLKCEKLFGNLKIQRGWQSNMNIWLHLTINDPIQHQNRGPDHEYLTFPEEWGFVTVHQFFGDQFEVGHDVVPHGPEGTMFCYLLDGFLTQITAEKICHSPESCRKILEEGHMFFNPCEAADVFILYSNGPPEMNVIAIYTGRTMCCRLRRQHLWILGLLSR